MGNYSDFSDRADGKDFMKSLARMLDNHKNQKQEVSVNIDTSQITNAVSNILEEKLKNIPQKMYNNAVIEEDRYSDENTGSLEKLADSMLVQRGDSKANFEDLGGVDIHKKDKTETDRTIDLLSNLDD